MSDVYKFTIDEKETSSALIYSYKLASLKLVQILPKGELKILASNKKKIARFRWVGVGDKYYHPVYLFIYFDEENQYFLLINKPKYPLYLLGFLGSMIMLGFHPAVIVNTEKDIRSIVVNDYEKATTIAREMLKHGVISGRKFLDFDDISYNGYLYEVPIGFIAFLDKKPPFEPIDIITRHIEYDWWIHPLELTINAFSLAEKK